MRHALSLYLFFHIFLPLLAPLMPLC